MNIESVSKTREIIHGTIINVSFPRSGHHFLRLILSGYFEGHFVIYEHYTEEINAKSALASKLQTVNIVKTHDFELAGRDVLLLKFPENRRYLVQIRHPLESITSYYEFSMKHGHLPEDSEAIWNSFLRTNLRYWKLFCELWVLNQQNDSLLVTYNDLYADTYGTAGKAIRFLTDRTSLDTKKLARVLEGQVFLQYDGDTGSRKQNRRQLKSFKYYNARKFEKIETTLVEKYLKPQGTRLLFQ